MISLCAVMCRVGQFNFINYVFLACLFKILLLHAKQKPGKE